MFLLKDAKGRLVRLQAHANCPGYDGLPWEGGDVSYEFVQSAYGPLFAVGTYDQALEALRTDTPWYNASAETPGHSSDKAWMKGLTIFELKEVQ